MSFTDIAAIIRKETGESNKDNNNKPTMTKETEVLKLFKKGKAPVEIAALLSFLPNETNFSVVRKILVYGRWTKV
jgi:hypothetical protein